MSCSRRALLKNAVKGAVAASLPISAFKFLSPSEVKAAIGDDKVRWGFLVDTTKCVGCGFCVKACKTENHIPYDAAITRTWVERYVVLPDNRGQPGNYLLPCIDRLVREYPVFCSC